MLAEKEYRDNQEIPEIASSYDAFKLLKKYASDFGFSKFSVVEVPWEDHLLADVMIMNNWDPEFIQAYDQLELAKNSPIFKHVRRSVLPLVFDVHEIQKAKPTDQRLQAMKDFKAFSETKGLIIPVSTAGGLRGAVTFTGTSLQLTQNDIDSLHVRSINIFEKIIENRSVDTVKRPVLSSREMDCLKWTAIGKTSSETAIILEVSENTVNHHLASICKKLDCINRIHAVAKAIRLRLID